jgi:hypothetical protein
MIFLIKIFRLDHIGIVRLYLRSTAGVLLLPVTFLGDDAWDKILLVDIHQRLLLSQCLLTRNISRLFISEPKRFRIPACISQRPYFELGGRY